MIVKAAHQMPADRMLMRVDIARSSPRSSWKMSRAKLSASRCRRRGSRSAQPLEETRSRSFSLAMRHRIES